MMTHQEVMDVVVRIPHPGVVSMQVAFDLDSEVFAAHANGANLRTFSKGIWRSVYLLPVAAAGAALTAMTPLVFFDGGYPAAPLVDGANGPWHVDVRTVRVAIADNDD